MTDGGSQTTPQRQGFHLDLDVADNLHVGVWSVDRDGVSLWANRFLCDLLDVPIEGIVGEQLLQFWHRDDHELIHAHMRRRREGSSDHYDAHLQRRDGTPVPVRVQASPLFEDGEFVGAIAFLTDLSDVAAAAIERDAALREAQAAAVATSRLLSWVSHELRTPLNTIAGFAQLLQESVGVPSQREMATSIVAASTHVNDLVQDLLDYSKAEANVLEPALETVALRAVVDEALSLVSGSARTLQVTIDVAVADDLWVVADRRHLVQAVLNLLSNAVKYGGHGTTVRVRGDADERLARLSISDEGPGIAPELQQRVFQPFERLERDDAVEGVGLGLSIADSFVRSMHGSLRLISPPGDGATFTIELPVGSPDEPAADDAPAAPAANQLVLYVEDEPLNASLVESIIGLLPGRTLHVEPTVRGGIEAAKRLRPALFLLDLNLPDGTGFEVLAAVRADPALAASPVFILSADATEQTTMRAHELGADRFISKPFNLKEFVALVEAATAAT
jgi:PAS domain S-box-containing protein